MNPDALARIRFLFYDQNRWDLAERELQKHPELLVDNAEAHAIMGRCAINRESFPEARSYLRTSLEINPEFSNALYYLAVLEFLVSLRQRCKDDEQWHLHKAEKWIRDAIRLRNDAAEYHAELACILINRGRFRKALAAAETAVSISPDDAYCLRTKGRALIDCNRHREAIDVLNKSLRLDPQAGCTHLYLYLAKPGWFGLRGRHHLQIALQLAPNDRELREYCLSNGRIRLPSLADCILIGFLICLFASAALSKLFK
jgi:tetratricopeptide (TPR) repeat protein